MNPMQHNIHGAWGQPILLTSSSDKAPLSPTMIANIRSSIESAGRTNRSGVLALASGDVAAATASFGCALQDLRNLSAFVLERVADSGPTPDLHTQGGNLMSKAGPVLEAVSVPVFEDDYIYLYGNALDFLEDTQLHTSPGTTATGMTELEGEERRFAFQVSFYSAIVMFNLAICKHKRGLNFNDDASLFTAIHLYDMSMQTISNIPITDYSDKLMLVMLAIWNNQSQIYWLLESYEHAKLILEGVRRLAARLLLEHRTSLDEDDQSHIFEFVLNVIIARVPTNAPCA